MKQNEFDILHNADAEELSRLCPPGDERRMERIYAAAMEKSASDAEVFEETAALQEKAPRLQWTRAAVIAASLVICAASAAGIRALSRMTPPPEEETLEVTPAVSIEETVTETEAESSAASETVPAAAMTETTAGETAASASTQENAETVTAVTSRPAQTEETAPAQTRTQAVQEPTAPATKATEPAVQVSAAGVYSSRSGIITLNADGTGTIEFQDTVPIRWDSRSLIGADFVYPYTLDGDTITVDVDGMLRSFTKGGELPQSDIPPVTYIVGDYYGTYPADRASMYVEATGENSVQITVTWGSSAWSSAEWTMSGVCEEQGDSIQVSYQDCTLRYVEYNSDGSVASETTEFTNGTGTVTFTGMTAEWNNDSETTDGVLVFEYAAGVN